jgi:hypothetical protein
MRGTEKKRYARLPSYPASAMVLLEDFDIKRFSEFLK